MFHLIGFYDYTVILTHLSLACAVVGLIFARNGRADVAILCLLISGFLDLFDGSVARTKKNRTQEEKSFGIQLDSLCDMVAFGALPAMICYTLGMDGILGVTILCIYCILGLTRLAFFNVMEEKRQKTEGGYNKYYRGLPITSVAIILPAFCLIGLLLPDSVFVIALHILIALTAFLFVLDVKVRKWAVRLPAKKEQESEQELLMK